MRLTRMLICAHYSAFNRELPDELSILGAIISTNVGRPLAAIASDVLRL
jgi:hypothetical protein